MKECSRRGLIMSQQEGMSQKRTYHESTRRNVPEEDLS